MARHLVSVGGDALVGSWPVRLPVWWARWGSPGAHPEVPGVSGRLVIIRHLKRMKRLERALQRVMRAPLDLRRPLDRIGSLLWELCDGSRPFEALVELLDETLHEAVAPAPQRSEAALVQWRSLGLVHLLPAPFDGRWPTGPGVDPTGGVLPVASAALELDTTPLPGEGSPSDW